VASSDADYGGLRSDVQKAGGRIVREMPEIQTLVVRAPKDAKGKMAASKHASAVAADHIESLSPPDQAAASPAHRVTKVSGTKLGPSVTPDPAYFLSGLLWNEARVRMTDAFRALEGSPRPLRLARTG
jgi:hypothetical protein